MINKFNKLKQLNLQDEEKELLLSFFLTYSCLEYALKVGDFAQEKKEAKADWKKYIEVIEEEFDKNANEELSDAYDYLLKLPPEKLFRLPKYGFRPFEPRSTTKIGQLSEYVRCVRNNLFHGSKSYRLERNPTRNKRLLQSCITILEEFVRISPLRVKEDFKSAVLQL